MPKTDGWLLHDPQMEDNAGNPKPTYEELERMYQTLKAQHQALLEGVMANIAKDAGSN